MTPLAALQHYFQLDAFRSPQAEIVAAVLAGKDALVVMPTGGGKSLCYQLPALLLPGVTIVVSPLIALMKDQVDGLLARGLPASVINSSQTWEEQRDTLARIRNRSLKLVYVAPERFRSASFLNAVPNEAISLLAIDEAHCLSQWGHDFRPDYLRLGDVREALGSPACVALTATATPEVQKDIKTVLRMQQPTEFIAGFARGNLSFRVRKTRTRSDKESALINLIRKHKTGIVYCATRKTVDQVADAIESHVSPVIRYHGGLDDEARTLAQETFMRREADVVVATNAFGMGIDRSDIRFVCHYEMPGSVEAYYQEAGRAGRDGSPSTCELLFSYADKRVQEFFIEGANPTKAQIATLYNLLRGERNEQNEVLLSIDDLCERHDEKVNPMAVSTALGLLARQRWIERFDIPGRRIRGTRILNPDAPLSALPFDESALKLKSNRDAERLKKVIEYAYADGCRQGWILRYFGDTTALTCGLCDGCQEDKQSSVRALAENEVTRVRMALSGVARMSERIDDERWRPKYGRRKIIQCLLGAETKDFRENGLDQISTFAILKGEGSAYVEKLFSALEKAQLIETHDVDGFPLVTLTSAGSRAMFSGKLPELALPERTAGYLGSGREKGASKQKKGQTILAPKDQALFEKLTTLRSELAAKNGKPAYTIFANSVLLSMANQRPTTNSEAIKIRGIGPGKLKTVLPRFLETIIHHGHTE